MFFAVQSAARRFNELYPPKNKKYKAGKDVSFSPEGYKTEMEAIAEISTYPAKEESKSEKLKGIFNSMKNEFPELYDIIKDVVK